MKPRASAGTFEAESSFLGLVWRWNPNGEAGANCQSISGTSESTQKTNPPEWYLEVNRLLHLQGTSSEDQVRIRREILDGGDDVMCLYLGVAALERKGDAAN